MGCLKALRTPRARLTFAVSIATTLKISRFLWFRER